jgi:cysteine dioxygenase
MARMMTPTGTTQDPAELFPKLAPLIAYLDSLASRADLSVLERLLTETNVSRCDIASTCIFGIKGYRRNCISRSDWYELLACCWHSADRTPIHDHRGVSCAFKVIEGEGTEIRFKTTPSGLICPTQSVTMPCGYICAANDSDIHQVANMQNKDQDLVTLHIYSPPISKMHTYDYGQPSTAEAGNCYETPC